MLEHYAVYWDFEDNMKFMEDMFDHLFATLEISPKIPIKDKEGNEQIVDFSTPWQRVDYVERIKADCGIDVSKYGAEDEVTLRELIRSK